jgi:hypothetical protein
MLAQQVVTGCLQLHNATIVHAETYTTKHTMCSKLQNTQALPATTTQLHAGTIKRRTPAGQSSLLSNWSFEEMFKQQHHMHKNHLKQTVAPVQFDTTNKRRGVLHHGQKTAISCTPSGHPGSSARKSPLQGVRQHVACSINAMNADDSS